MRAKFILAFGFIASFGNLFSLPVFGVCKAESDPVIAKYAKEIRLQSDKKDLEELGKFKEDELITAHDSYGRWIRNTWFHGKGKKKDLIASYQKRGLINADDMSIELTKLVWCELTVNGTKISK